MGRPSVLLQVLKAVKITDLLDIRTTPFSRNDNFCKEPLKAFLSSENIEYHWMGQSLGGLGSKITDERLEELWEWSGDKRICLMCMEKKPQLCHRYFEIGRRLELKEHQVHHIRYIGGLKALYKIEIQGDQIGLFA